MFDNANVSFLLFLTAPTNMQHQVYSTIAFLLANVVAQSTDPIINTRLGKIRGLEMTFSETGDKIYQFRGIRYGKSTAGENRFRKPQPVEKSDALYNATSFGAICPQMIWSVDLDVPTQSEDCLFLNVYVPKELRRQALPVMIWVHGGGLAEGYSQIFDGSRIAVVGDVIVVTINYRLGFFGFLSFLHPSARGNWGLWDQQLAFQWVHDNILAFGGNPDSVTIFGESSGGESVSYHSIIPSNKGLFQRVIAQSGSMSRINMLHRKPVETLKSRLPVLTGCSTNDLYQLVDCLRRKSVADLLELSYTVLQQPDDQILIANVFGIAVDGDMFPAHPFRLLANRTSPQSQFFSNDRLYGRYYITGGSDTALTYTSIC